VAWIYESEGDLYFGNLMDDSAGMAHSTLGELRLLNAPNH
jgi:hypothetical protein